MYCVFIVICFSIKAQTNEDDYSHDGYYRSLVLHVEYLNELEDNVDTVYVQKNYYLQDYTGGINETYVKMVGQEFLYKKTKKRGRIDLIVINPMKFEKGVPTFFVVNFDVSRRRKKYIRKNVDRSKLQMKYDCQKSKNVISVVNR